MLIFLLLALAVHAADMEAPAAELLRFDQRVTVALRGRADASLKNGLRAELEGIRRRVPFNPANTELHGLIKARLEGGTGRSSSAALAAGRRRHEQGDYVGALAYADAVLASDPGNAAAVGLKRMSEGRARGPAMTPAAAPRPAPAAAAATTPTGTADVDKPYKLAMKVRPSLGTVPMLSAEGEKAGYISPSAKKSGLMRRIYDRVATGVAYMLHRSTPEEAAKLDSVKRMLASTPTGQRLVSELGGWAEINRHVNVTFTPMPSKGYNAYTLQLDLAASRHALVLNTELLSHPDEIVAPILAHELRHLSDSSKGGLGGGLAIPSELAAHRIQVYVFKEVETGLSAERRALLERNDKWNYNRFMADLWQDKILQRFPNRDEFVASYPSSDLEARARVAYQDLELAIVRPGSPHLDHHLTSPKDGVYAVMSDEKDILDIVEQRKHRGRYSDTERLNDERILNRRSSLMAEIDRVDSDYRQENGFQIE